MYHFTVPMALMDFVPVIFFGVSAFLLLRDLYGKMNAMFYALLAGGSVNVFLAGFCKALWKLLYAANICDFVVLEKMFLPVNAIGLLLVGVGLAGMLARSKKNLLLSVAPVSFTSSLPFIIMMTLGLGGMCAVLSTVAVKMKQPKTMIWFILSFVCAMGMGAMSSQDSTQSWVNWAEQSINTVSQLCLMLGVISLDKAGLKDWN